MRFGDFAGWVPQGPVLAQVINLDGQQMIRLTHAEGGTHIGYFPSVESIVAAGFDLAQFKIGA